MGWTRFFRRQYWDAERARELQAYLDQEIDDNVARGMTPQDAARAAHRKLGNVARIREDIYQMNTIGFLESAWQDLRYGARLLRRNPTFAIVAILTLALGTGANAAMFQLVEITVDAGDRGRMGSFTGRRPMLTNPLWERIRDRQTSLSSVMAWSNDAFDLAEGGEVRPAQGLWVSGSFFGTLGVGAAHGRLISPADDVRGCAAPGAVLSHAFWQREYHADRSVVGRTLLLDGRRFDIVGVSAAGFSGVEVGRSFDVALPICAEPIFRAERTRLDRVDGWFLAVMGRLGPNQTVDAVTTELRALSAPMFRETLPPRFPPDAQEQYLAFTLTAQDAPTGVSSLRRSYATPLWVLFGLTGTVLLIACANLANLMLARATTREREVSVRLALGAPRRRIVRQMLSESLLLAVAGSAVGLVLARWLSAFLVRFLSSGPSQLFLDLAFNWRVFVFTAMVASIACLLFGLTPALRVTAYTPATTMLGTRGASEGRERFTLRRALVVAQVALSLVLLVGAIFFGRSLRNLMTLDPGFRPAGVIAASVDSRRAGIVPERRRAVFESIVERVRGVPGVRSVAETFITPLSGSGWNDRIVIDAKRQDGIVNFNAAGPDYFRTLGTRVIAGREFTPHDTPASPMVAIVNELFVKRYMPGGNPIGRVFHFEDVPGGPPSARYQIVGVVADAKYRTMREEMSAIAYLAASQQPPEDPGFELLVHTTIDPATVTPAITQALREVHPAMSVSFQMLDDLLKNSVTSERLMAALSGFFGGLAVLIATIGLYGVMSYMVARRRMEIGIRMALGADRSAVVRMVIGDASRLLALGLVLGSLLAVAGARSATSLLYGLAPWDLTTLATGAIALGVVALIASWWPAHRASRVPPTTALREG
jgi:putative ABC transport system permease protein